MVRKESLKDLQEEVAIKPSFLRTIIERVFLDENGKILHPYLKASSDCVVSN